jgi:hypothetical protein
MCFPVDLKLFNLKELLARDIQSVRRLRYCNQIRVHLKGPAVDLKEIYLESKYSIKIPVFA